MSRRKFFDRFMVDNENGRNLKLMRLSDAEYRALLAGVWPIASKADVRGTFMVGGTPATAEDVVHQSPKTTKRAAMSLLAKLRDMGMLEFDDELGGEWVHDWDTLNPAPKADPTNAKRQAEWRSRNAASNGTDNAINNGPRNGEVTPTEVKKRKKEDPPKPPQGGRVTFARKPVPKATLELAEQLLDEFNTKAGTHYGAYTAQGQPSEDLRRILGALIGATPPLTFDEGQRIIRWRLAAPERFWQGKPHTGVVFGPGVFSSNRENATATTGVDDLDAMAARTEQRLAREAAA